MARTPRQPSQTEALDRMIASGDPVFVRNNMANAKSMAGRPHGDLIIGLVDSDSKRSITLAIPKNSTVCLTDQVSHSMLKGANDLRRLLGNGVLVLLDEKAYEELQDADPDHVEYSEEQLERLTGTLDGMSSGGGEEAASFAPSQEDAMQMSVRPAITGLVVSMQCEEKSQTTLTQELKALIPDMTTAEKQLIKDNASKVPADRAKLRNFIAKL